MAKGTSRSRMYRCGVIGYGGAFNMGWTHLSMMSANPRMEVASVCELDRKRLEVATEDWPQAALYSRVGDMLRFADLDLVAVINALRHDHGVRAPLGVHHEGVAGVRAHPP